MARYLGRTRRGCPSWKFDEMEMSMLRASAARIAEAKHESARERYRLDGREPHQRDLEGLMGEYATAVHFDVDVDLSATSGKGDDGYDLIFPDGTRMGVKSSRYFDAKLLVKVSEPICDVYVLCRVDVDRMGVSLEGQISGEFVESREPRRVHVNGPVNRVVERDSLLPLGDPFGYEELVRSMV